MSSIGYRLIQEVQQVSRTVKDDSVKNPMLLAKVALYPKSRAGSLLDKHRHSMPSILSRLLGIRQKGNDFKETDETSLFGLRVEILINRTPIGADD